MTNRIEYEVRTRSILTVMNELEREEQRVYSNPENPIRDGLRLINALSQELKKKEEEIERLKRRLEDK